MATRYMERFFNPRSIAVIGASQRPQSLGGTVLRNLLDSGFRETLMAVNPRAGEQVLGLPCFSRVAALPEVPDLAIVCTSAGRIPAVVDELGKRGVRAVMIVMGGFSRLPAASRGPIGHFVELAQDLLGVRLDGGQTLREATWEVAQSYDMRIMGPNCMGVVVPRHRLNASYAHCMVPNGNVAYVGHSGVLGLAMMDWARGRSLGFSCLTTLGDSLDINVADIVEYLADDVRTRAILLHIERLHSGRRLVSALRAAARNKLVIAMKSQRTQPGSGRASVDDVVFDAVFRRTGVLRVARSAEFFDALETLTRMRRLGGQRLAIVCNGMGPADLAADRVHLRGGELAVLSDDTRVGLSAHLPPVAAIGNPVDMGVIAVPDNFEQVLKLLDADRHVDAVLIIHVPTLIAPALATAQAVGEAAQATTMPILTCWMGDHSARPARAALDRVGVPTFESPESAVDAFMYMADYRRNQQQLDQSPPVGAQAPALDATALWALVGRIQSEGRSELRPEEAANVAGLSGIEVIGGDRWPGMNELRSLQLTMGITRDPEFGPLVFFGTGAMDSALAERQVGLPPLNLNLARVLIDSTRVGCALGEYSKQAESILEQLASMLTRLSQLVVEVSALAELEIAPVVVNADGIFALGISARLGERCETAIVPYPAQLEETITLRKSGRQVMLRPIRAEDASAHAAFVQRLSPEAIRFRFFGPRSSFTQRQLAQFTQIDYAREMAFIASARNSEGVEETLGVVRTWTDPDNISAEFAIIVADGLRGERLGFRLMEKIIAYTRERGTLELYGTVLSDNQPMQQLARKLGFTHRFSAAEQVLIVTLRLNEPVDDWQRIRLEKIDD